MTDISAYFEFNVSRVTAEKKTYKITRVIMEKQAEFTFTIFQTRGSSRVFFAFKIRFTQTIDIVLIHQLVVFGENTGNGLRIRFIKFCEDSCKFRRPVIKI